MSSYRSDLSRISILIKCFLRDQHAAEAIGGCLASMPEARLIVVDDGIPSPTKAQLYAGLRANGHVVLELPYDSGFGAKSNAAIDPAQARPYMLVGADDFSFQPPSVRQGIEKLVAVLDGEPLLSIASGRVNNVKYEGWLDDYGDRVRERYIDYSQPHQTNGVVWHPCDLTVNYSLIRSSVLGPEKLHWFSNVKIGGGEHGAFFVVAKRLGYAVAYVPGVNICEQSGKPTDIRYPSYRGRASQPGRQAFKEIGVREYVLFDGTVERA